MGIPFPGLLKHRYSADKATLVGWACLFEEFLGMEIWFGTSGCIEAFLLQGILIDPPEHKVCSSYSRTSLLSCPDALCIISDSWLASAHSVLDLATAVATSLAALEADDSIDTT